MAHRGAYCIAHRGASYIGKTLPCGQQPDRRTLGTEPPPQQFFFKKSLEPWLIGLFTGKNI
jgi:hypothetical protein